MPGGELVNGALCTNFGWADLEYPSDMLHGCLPILPSTISLLGGHL